MPSDRFFLFKAGGAPAPNQCMICGTPDRDLIDFRAKAMLYNPEQNFSLQRGAVLFCVSCMDNLVADLLPHWVPRAELETMKVELNESRIRVLNFDLAMEQFNADLARSYSAFVDGLNAQPPVEEARQDNQLDLFGNAFADLTTNS